MVAELFFQEHRWRRSFKSLARVGKQTFDIFSKSPFPVRVFFLSSAWLLSCPFSQNARFLSSKIFRQSAQADQLVVIWQATSSGEWTDRNGLLQWPGKVGIGFIRFSSN